MMRRKASSKSREKERIIDRTKIGRRIAIQERRSGMHDFETLMRGCRGKKGRKA